MTLSILCVTNAEPHAGSFLLRMSRLARLLDAEFVIGLDGERAHKSGFNMWCTKTINLNGAGYIESVLDEAVNNCAGDFIFRLDDDEAASPALGKWLLSGAYKDADVWCFPRVYLWKDDQHYIPELFPDVQTRLTTKGKAGGRNVIHSGSPYGTGRIAPYAIEHHKLLVKTIEERERILDHYETIQVGAGRRPEFAKYNLPELFTSSLTSEDYSDGDYSAR